MGRNSYLGGSTIIHRGTGGSASRQRKVKLSREQQAHMDYIKEISLLELERENIKIANSVTAFLYDGAGKPQISSSQLFDSAVFFADVPLASAHSVKTAIRAFKEEGGDFVRFISDVGQTLPVSAWRYQDSQRRQAIVGFLRDAKHPRIIGVYPTVEALIDEGVSHGWVAVADMEQLAHRKTTEFKELADRFKKTKGLGWPHRW